MTTFAYSISMLEKEPCKEWKLLYKVKGQSLIMFIK
jgi:hypothetical protein